MVYVYMLCISVVKCNYIHMYICIEVYMCAYVSVYNIIHTHTHTVGATRIVGGDTSSDTLRPARAG